MSNHNDCKLVPGTSYADRLKGKQSYVFTSDDHVMLKSALFNGEPSITVPTKLAKEGVDLLQYSLIGRLNFNGLKINKVLNILEEQWKLGKGSCKLSPMSRGFFIIKLQTQEAKEHVWHGGRWTVEKQFLRVINFSPNFNPDRQASSKATVWVTFPGLYVELWTSKILYGMASWMGRPIAIDQKTLDLDFCNFASVLVEVDFAKPIPKRIRVFANGNEFWQPAEVKNREAYLFCEHCKVLGHLLVNCSIARRKYLREATTKKQVEEPSVAKDPVAEKGLRQPMERNVGRDAKILEVLNMESSASFNRFQTLDGTSHEDVGVNEGSMVWGKTNKDSPGGNQYDKNSVVTSEAWHPVRGKKPKKAFLQSKPKSRPEGSSESNGGKALEGINQEGERSERSKQITRVRNGGIPLVSRYGSRQEDSIMSAEELKEFNLLKGKEVKEKFKNDLVFRKNWLDREKRFASEMCLTSEKSPFSSSTSNRFTVLNGLYLEAEGKDVADGSRVGQKEATTGVGAEQGVDQEAEVGSRMGQNVVSTRVGTKLVVNQEAREDKRNQSEHVIKGGVMVVGPLSTVKDNNPESSTKEGEGMDSAMVTSSVGKNSDGVNLLLEKESSLSESHLKEKVEVSKATDQGVRKMKKVEVAKTRGAMVVGPHTKELLKLEDDQNVNLASTKKASGKWGEIEIPLEVSPKKLNAESSLDPQIGSSGIGDLLSEGDENSVKVRLIDGVENTSTIRKESQGRDPKPSIEQTKAVKVSCGDNSEAHSVLTTEELLELGKISTLSIRNNFLLSSDYRREWMERNVILDNASSFEGHVNFDSEESDDDEFSENTSYVNCDSETLAHALSLGGRKSRFRARISKGSRRHWG